VVIFYMQVVIDYHYGLIDYCLLKNEKLNVLSSVIDYQGWLIDYQSQKIENLHSASG